MSFFYFLLTDVMFLFNLFLTEVLMNTKTETSDLKWTIFSTAKPEVRNPSFSMLSVLLTRTMWWLGIFGFQLFLCYFGYKRVPYIAGNWQNKEDQCECGIPSILKADALIYPINPGDEVTGISQFGALPPEKAVFVIWSADGWLLGYFCQQRNQCFKWNK